MQAARTLVSQLFVGALAGALVLTPTLTPALTGCGGGSGAGSDGSGSNGNDAGAGPGTPGNPGPKGTSDAGNAGSGADAGNAGNDAGNDGGAATGPSTTTIRVHYPLAQLGGSHALTLRGSSAPLTWNAGTALASTASDTYTFTVTGVTAALQVKPLLDDATWSLGPNYNVAPGATVDIYPRFTTTNGSWSRAYDFTSTVLGNTRGIWIYLPPTYLENTDARMPVVYMHDGQNLFDPKAAFGGNAWNVGQTMDAGANDGSIAEAIVIGVENTADRINEYTPVADPTYGGGKGDSYLTMLITELKPKIDGSLRTLPDRDHTAMLGSSLGGLISAYAGVTHADTYGIIGVMSPSTWWDNTWLIPEVGTTKATPRPDRVYVDSGNAGDSNDDVTNTAALAAEYRTIGYKDNATLDYLVQAGGQHNEIYWAERLPGAMAFLLGPGR